MLFQFVSDYNGEDRFMTRIGVGGLINLDKLRQSHIVLNDIHLFHHHATLQRAMDARLQEEDRSRLVLMVYCLPSVWQSCRRLVLMTCFSSVIIIGGWCR